MDYLKNMNYADIEKIQNSITALVELLKESGLNINYPENLNIKYDFDNSDDIDFAHHVIIEDSKNKIIFENTWIE